MSVLYASRMQEAAAKKVIEDRTFLLSAAATIPTKNDLNNV